jgi:hypothetical protein
MSACKKWHEELTEHALGGAASPALTAHLDRCAACSATLGAWRARVRQIDAGLRQLAASEPSPPAASRMLAEIRLSQPERFLGFGWKTVAAAVMGVTILLASVSHFLAVQERRQQTEKTLAAAAALARWRSPTQGLLRSPTDQWTGSVPRLGEYFYELKPGTPKPRKEKEDR